MQHFLIYAKENKDFIHNVELVKHRAVPLRRHLPWQFIPYVCNDCQIRFVDHSALVMHAQSNDHTLHTQAGSEIIMGLRVRANAAQFQLDNTLKFYKEGKLTIPISEDFGNRPLYDYG